MKNYRHKITGEIIQAKKWSSTKIGVYFKDSSLDGYLYNDEFNSQYDLVFLLPKKPSHLEFIYNRLIQVHNENPRVDYMVKFKEIIEEDHAK